MIKKSIILLFIIVGMVHYFLYLYLIPPWEGNDEPMHYEYIEILRRGYVPSFSFFKPSRWWKKVPREIYQEVEEDIIHSMEKFHFWEINELRFPRHRKDFSAIYRGATAIHQAPLYYLICSVSLRVFNIRSSLEGLYISRIITLIIGLCILFLILLMGRFYFGKRDSLFLLSSFLVLVLPMPSMLSSLVNNDSLAVFFSSAILTYMVYSFHRGRKSYDFAILLTLMSFALWSKRTTIAFFPLIAIFPIIRSIPNSTLTKTIRIFISIGLVFFILAVLLMYPLQEIPLLTAHQGRIGIEHFTTNFLNLSNQKTFFIYFFKSFCGTFVWGHKFMDNWVYFLFLLIISISILVHFGKVWFSRESSSYKEIIRQRTFLLFIVAIFLQIGLIYGRFFYQIPTWNIAQGRYAASVLGPIFILLIDGLFGIFNTKFRNYLIIIIAGGALLFDIMVQLKYILPYFYMYYY